MDKRYRVYDLGDKEVINLEDGARLGYVDDVEIAMPEGRVLSIILLGRPRFFGLLGREEDIIIPWGNIERVGEDIIFIRYKGIVNRSARSRRRDYRF